VVAMSGRADGSRCHGRRYPGIMLPGER
jgi:hypothetical protein